MSDFGLIHIYCGDGKGKTTAALGLSLRCSGCGYKVIFAQFLKSGDSGELVSLSSLPNITVVRATEHIPFTFNMKEEDVPRIINIHNNILQRVKEIIAKEDICLVILDEIIATMNCELIDCRRVYDFLDQRPKHLEVVLTGRDPSDELCARADYISEIKKVKHPFDKGVYARQGIEK